MSKFLIVRLGKDSVSDIKKIDSLRGIQAPAFRLNVRCKQAPKEASAGDYAWIWLGSDNSKGAPTDWKQGIRAFGKLVNISGGPGYNDNWDLLIEISIIFPESILSKDLVANAPIAYYWCCDMPVLGLNTYSNQTAQLIKESEPNQSVKALMYAIEARLSGFKAQVEATYPELIPYFNYTPISPKSADSVAPFSGLATDESIPKSFPASWILALASKGFLLISGPSGTGKSRTARDIARALDYTLAPEFSATANSCRPANCLAFVSVGAGWTNAVPLLGAKNIFGRERQQEAKDGHTYKTNDAWDPPAAMRLLLRASFFPDQPHFLVLDEMNLSHVERYFGPFLSLMESNRGLDQYSKHLLLEAEDVKLIAETLSFSEKHPLEKEAAEHLVSKNSGLTIGDNVFIIGTVNVDETTYMFSPKVLDRAQVLEMLAPFPDSYLDNASPTLPDLLSVEKAKAILKRSIERRRYGFWEREHPIEILRQAAQSTNWSADYEEIFAALKRTLSGLQKILSPVGFSFAYRTMNEICAYLGTYLEADDQELFKKDGTNGWQNALDRIVYQKILPRLHGNRRQLGDSLRAIVELFEGGTTTYKMPSQVINIGDSEKIGFPLKLCSDKARTMLLRLEATGHTTFVE